MAFINKGRGMNVTIISNIFIDEYMLKANGTFVKIYLYGYKSCCCGNYELTASQIAQSMDIIESDVISAWKYWEEQGIMKLYYNEAANSYDVEYLDIVHKKENKAKQDIPAKSNLMQTKPHYSLKELEIYINNSAEIRNLFEYAKNTMGKLLTSNDMELIYSFYDYYRLPIDVIKVLIAYYSDKSMRYIEKVAIEWSDKGIDTLDKAEDHMKEFGQYKKVMKFFGIENVNINAKHREFITKWIKNYKMGLEIINEAAQRTIFKTGSPSFEYADSIITSWYKDNVKSVEDIKKLDEAFEYNKKKEQENRKNININNNTANNKDKFGNYNQREWDFEELKRLEREYNKIN